MTAKKLIIWLIMEKAATITITTAAGKAGKTSNRKNVRSFEVRTERKERRGNGHEPGPHSWRQLKSSLYIFHLNSKRASGQCGKNSDFPQHLPHYKNTSIFAFVIITENKRNNCGGDDPSKLG